jgi:hypothetical protein
VSRFNPVVAPTVLVLPRSSLQLGSCRSVIRFESWFSLYRHFCPPMTCHFPPPALFLVGFRLVAVFLSLVGGYLFDAGFFLDLVQMCSFVPKVIFACSELDLCDSFPRVFDVWSRDMVVMVRWW